MVTSCQARPESRSQLSVCKQRVRASKFPRRTSQNSPHAIKDGTSGRAQSACTFQTCRRVAVDERNTKPLAHLKEIKSHTFTKTERRLPRRFAEKIAVRTNARLCTAADTNPRHVSGSLPLCRVRVGRLTVRPSGAVNLSGVKRNSSFNPMPLRGTG